MLVTIANQNFAGVVDTFGGELISLIDTKGNEYLWGGDETYWSGRSPHLFPIIGTLKENELLAENEKYILGKHGFLRNSQFTVIKHSEDKVILSLKASKKTLQMYPYEFTFYVIHTLKENGFTTTYQIINEDIKNIYFNVGGHLGIRCPLTADESFEDYQIVFDEELTGGVYFPVDDRPIKSESITAFFHETTTLDLTYSYFEKGPMIIDKISSKSFNLISRKSGKNVKFIYKDYPVLAFWTLGNKKAPYLCLEPWHGLPAMEEDTGEFKEKPYMIELEPGKEKTLEYSLEIIKSNMT